MERFGARHVLQRCCELSWSSEQEQFVTAYPGQSFVPFKTVAEALAVSSTWQGVWFGFEVGNGVISLELLDGLDKSGRTVILEEGDEMFWPQLTNEKEAIRWRTLLRETAASIDADYYLMECESPHRSLPEGEFLQRITSQPVSVPWILAFNQRVCPTFETELILPPDHKWERSGSIIEILRKDFGSWVWDDDESS